MMLLRSYSLVNNKAHYMKSFEPKSWTVRTAPGRKG